MRTQAKPPAPKARAYEAFAANYHETLNPAHPRTAFDAGWDACAASLTAADGLTTRQAEVLRAIVSLRDADGCAPTMVEIAEKLGVSKVTVFEHLKALREKGRVAHNPRRARSIRLIGEQA